jgi:hypothetical protein
MMCHFKLEITDVSDQLKEAQAKLQKMKTLQIAKQVGADRSDIQALGEEYGFGMMDLDNYDNAREQTNIPFNMPSTSVQSTSEELEPSEVTDEDDLPDALFEAYKKGISKIKEL